MGHMAIFNDQTHQLSKNAYLHFIESTPDYQNINLVACFPELFIMRLITPSMTDNSVTTVMGAVKYTSYYGAGEKTRYDGIYDDTFPTTSDGTLPRTFIFIDPYDHCDYREYTEGFYRDLNKMVNGIMLALPTHVKLAVAGYPIGCSSHADVIKANKKIKFIQQYLACSITNMICEYYPDSYLNAGDIDFLAQTIKFVNKIKENDVTVADILRKTNVLIEEVRRDVVNAYNEIDLTTLDFYQKVLG